MHVMSINLKHDVRARARARRDSIYALIVPARGSGYRVNTLRRILMPARHSHLCDATRDYK